MPLGCLTFNRAMSGCTLASSEQAEGDDDALAPACWTLGVILKQHMVVLFPVVPSLVGWEGVEVGVGAPWHSYEVLGFSGAVCFVLLLLVFFAIDFVFIFCF